MILDKMKRDKKYAIKVVLIAVLALIVISNFGGKKEAPTQSECDVANQGGGCDSEAPILKSVTNDHCMESNIYTGEVVLDQASLCQNLGCVVGRELDSVGLIGEGYDEYACLPCAPVGVVVAKDTECCSGSARSLYYKEQNLQMCNTPTPDDVCTSDIQSSIGGIIDSIWSSNDMNCKTKFYMVVFGGGFIAVLLLMAVM